MNPMIQMLSGRSQQINPINLLLSGKRPEAILQDMLMNNPQFKQFYEANKNKSAKQIASENGLDWNTVKNILGSKG